MEKKSKKRIELICKCCKRTFKVHPYRKDIAKFCCRKCYHKYYKENPYKKNYKYNRIILICKQCGDEFEVIPSKLEQNFCSNKCSNDYFKGENSPTYKGKDYKICKQCGKEFTVYKYRSENAHFCCYECYWESLESSSREYCKIFNENFKVSIRTYFGKCFMTGKKYSEDETELAIHHVNYMKNCGCDSSMFCIYIPVTRGWNTKFNGSKKYNRWYWYSYLMKEIFLRNPNYYQFHIPVWGFSEMYYNYNYVFEKFRRR